LRKYSMSAAPLSKRSPDAAAADSLNADVDAPLTPVPATANGTGSAECEPVPTGVG